MSFNSKLVTIFLLLRLLGSGHCLIYDGFSKVFGTAGSATNVRTTRLLNQLCSESQNGNLERDACYGCFFRASTEPEGYPTLQSMSYCADNYLNDTDYGHCRNYLKNSTSPLDTRVSPTIVYCTFLECIRQVNKDALDALDAIRRVPRDPFSKTAKFIRRKTSQLLATRNYLGALRGICIIQMCVGEALRMFSNFTLTDVKLAQVFVNTTACILARTRCAVPNPITGDIQKTTDLPSKLGIPSVNALFVNSYYDINIIQLPFGRGVVDECAKFRNAQQANWPTVQCFSSSGF